MRKEEQVVLTDEKVKFWKKRWFRIVIAILVVLMIGGGIFLWKAGSVLNKISVKGGILKSITSAVPGISNSLKGENDGRINILLLGMRGANVPGGGLLADTIMVVSIKVEKEAQNNKVSMISIPRDLYVNNPVWGNQTKINAVYAAGEENDKKQGLEEMKKVVGDITGLPIHYGVVINFRGFTDLVNALGGITVSLAEPFNEGLQFHEPQVCDPYVYTIPTKPLQYQHKYYTRKDGTKYIAKSYPLCYNSNEECGGAFQLPAGKSDLDGPKALCYARARYSSNDFERAKRQQVVIEAIKDKALSLGTLSDFSKVNGMFNSLGDNLKTDMQVWEMEEFLKLEQQMSSPKIVNKVLDTSNDGLLYHPENSSPEAGYILLPQGDSYDKIREFFKNIFN